MIRNSLKLTAITAVALVGGAVGLNCSKGGSTDSGNLKIAFAIPGGDKINSVTYKITATSSGTTLLGGTINTSDPNSTASLDVALPPTAAGATDTVLLTATTVAGVACTTAPTTFAVVSGVNTNVMLSMVCGTSVPQTVPGTVDITTTVSTSNSCPNITSAVIAPDQTSVGGTVTVSTTGADPDGDSLTYAWGPAANFAAPTSATTTYTCTAAGTQTITLAISDGKCNATLSTLTIICVGAGTGGTTGTGGVAGAPGTGGVAGAPATGGTTGTGGVAGTTGTGGVAGTTGTGGSVVNMMSCASCEFNDSVNFCSGTTVSGNLDTVADFGCKSLTGNDVTTCQALVQCLRSTACQTAITTATSDYAEAGSNFDDPHPCLCGGATLAACLGATTWTGPCAAQYVAAANGGSVLNNYGNSASPIGLANNLMTCDVDSQIAANGLQKCGASCGLNTSSPTN